VDDNYLSPQRKVTLGIGREILRFTSLGNSGPILQEVDREPSSNDPFPEADVAVMFMNRFVIKPVLARPIKRYQLVADSIRPTAHTLDHQHKCQNDQDLPSASDQSPIDRTNNVQMVAWTTCLSAQTTSLSGRLPAPA
jgi:hypothetical protein